MRTGTILICSSLLATLAALFFFVNRGAGAPDADRDGMFWDEDVARFVRRYVAETYVDELDAEERRDAFYRAMDAYVSFDPYCEFIPPSDNQEVQQDISGKYAGLGVRIQEVAEGLELVGIYPGGPADKVGLGIGDTLVRADGTALAGIPLEHIAGLLKGRPGTQVRVGYIPGPRPTAEGQPPAPEREIVVTREEIRVPAVFTRRIGKDGRFGQIRLRDFAEASVQGFTEAVTRFTRGENPVEGLLLDLRHNGGGVLTVALRVADRFLDRGVIVKMEGRGADATRIHRAAPDGRDVLDLPLVVLVDGRSASASEVVAGALQDHRRALLVGERTFGKFLVQQITEIPGTGAALKLTTARYYTPNGRSYQGRGRHGSPDLGDVEASGLFPDVVVSLARDQLLAMREGWVNEEGQIWGIEVDPKTTPASHVDPQLARALELLEGQLALRKIRRR